ncbi:MAG: hypothetical protein M5U34_35415 [Chloroflexi bacterium]|nr:hypothetical protein [Chloroflexota bacterium]
MVGGKRPFCGNMDLEMAGLGNGPQLTKFTQVVGWETAVLPAAYEIYPGGRLETAVLWQHGFRNGRIGNGPQLTKIIQVVDGNGRSARSS